MKRRLSFEMPPLGAGVFVYVYLVPWARPQPSLTGPHCLHELSWEGPAGEEWWVRENVGLQLGNAAVLKGNVPGNTAIPQRNEILEKIGLGSLGRPGKQGRLGKSWRWNGVVRLSTMSWELSWCSQPFLKVPAFPWVDMVLWAESYPSPPLKFLCWSLNPHYHRLWLHLEVGPLKRDNEVKMSS